MLGSFVFWQPTTNSIKNNATENDERMYLFIEFREEIMFLRYCGAKLEGLLPSLCTIITR
ncbi:MAG: hypothetical protein EAZ95_01220 [Bacteroidetes bacterium]|nr:MAG: hypothetical protein EAZ95_01220 [Bacteroidota bacterium]